MISSCNFLKISDVAKRVGYGFKKNATNRYPSCANCWRNASKAGSRLNANLKSAISGARGSNCRSV
jgi:hypothetical protein